MAERVWITVGDNRVCPMCAPRDGVTQDWLASGLGLEPLHWGCRCVTVPADDASDTIEIYENVDEFMAPINELDDPFDRAEEFRALADRVLAGDFG